MSSHKTGHDFDGAIFGHLPAPRCTKEQFAKGHVKGSIETNAYPVKTDEEKARLAEVLPKLKASSFYRGTSGPG